MNGKKTAAQIIAGVLLRNATSRRERDRARREFQMIVACWRNQHGFRSPRG